MTTPDVNAVLRSQEYYRLKQTVQSPGDIYELDVSTRAVYIGPDSDIAEARIQYFDPDAPFATYTADVSVNGPFVGRVDADLTAQVPDTLQAARILVSPVDIVDNSYARALSTPPLRTFNVPAQIDLICALQDLPDIPSVRADKTFRFPNVPFAERSMGPGDDGSTDIVIPIYGRRMITIQVTNKYEITLEFFLVTLLFNTSASPADTPTPASIGTVTLPATGGGLPQTTVFVIKASDSVSEIDGTSDIPTTYIDLPMPLPSVKGMADLLVINVVAENLGPEVGYADFFVKLSDRES